MVDEFKGNSLFNDVSDPAVRTWNRCQVTYNITSSIGEEEAEEYLANFDDRTRATMIHMFTYIKKVGYDAARRNIFGTLRSVN